MKEAREHMRLVTKVERYNDVTVRTLYSCLGSLAPGSGVGVQKRRISLNQMIHVFRLTRVSTVWFGVSRSAMGRSADEGGNRFGGSLDDPASCGPLFSEVF